MADEKKPIKDLGYANNWDKTPQCVVDSRKAGHKVTEVNIGRCLTEYVCTEGGWRYRIDSSD